MKRELIVTADGHDRTVTVEEKLYHPACYSKMSRSKVGKDKTG